MKTVRYAGIVMIASCAMLLPLFAEGCSCELKPDLDGDTVLDLGSGVTLGLKRIPAGTFTMGSPQMEKGREEKEGPQRQVTITRPFHIGVTEVTQAQWRAVMNSQPWRDEDHAKEGDDNAASWIEWEEAMAFCKALSKKTGRKVRLPTEAEWEYACRGGTATRFSHGDDPDCQTLGDYAWYIDNTYCRPNELGMDMAEGYARPVARKKPNPWGLYDMHGNVYEFCSDWYADSYANAGGRDPKGPASGEWCVIRGGSWFTGTPLGLRSAARDLTSRRARDSFIGFRVVVEQ